ncbi:MAG: WG repeat-containing protein [Candidatus Ozemobacteraceae bacterium]
MRRQPHVFGQVKYELIDPGDYIPRQSNHRQERLLGEFIKRVGAPDLGGKDKRTGNTESDLSAKDSCMRRSMWFILAVVISMNAGIACGGIYKFSWPEDMPLKPVNLDVGVWGFDTGVATGAWGVTDEYGQYKVSPLFDKVAIFINGYAPVKKNGQWGFIDTEAQMTLPYQFDAIWQPPQPSGFRMVFTGDGETVEDAVEIKIEANWSAGFAPGIFPVRIGEKWGIIASSGNWIVPADLDEIQAVQGNRAMARRNGKFGFLDRTGAMVIEPTYDEVGPFAEGLAPGSRDGRWGFIDPAGKFVIQPRFAYAFSFINGSAIVQEGKLIGVLGTDGTWKLAPIYDSIVRDFANGLFRTELKSQYGLYSPLEGVLASPAWDFMWAEPHQLIKVARENRHGLLDPRGKALLPCAYDMLEVDQSDLVRLRQDGRWGFYDLKRNKLVDPVYTEIQPFCDGLAAAYSQGHWGYIDHTGQFAIPAQYDWASDFVNGKAAVYSASAGVVIDREGRIVEKPIPDSVGKTKLLPNGSRSVRFHNKFGFYRSDGTFTIAPSLDTARAFEDTGVILAEEAGFWRLIRPGDREMSPILFRSAGEVQENMCWVQMYNTKRYGFIDHNGNIVIEPIYDDAKGFHRDRAAVRKGKLWGFINSKGEVAIPLEYDDVSSFYESEEDAVKATRKGVKGLLDRMGNFYLLEKPTPAGTLRKAFPNAEKSPP